MVVILSNDIIWLRFVGSRDLLSRRDEFFFVFLKGMFPFEMINLGKKKSNYDQSFVSKPFLKFTV